MKTEDFRFSLKALIDHTRLMTGVEPNRLVRSDNHMDRREIDAECARLGLTVDNHVRALDVVVLQQDILAVALEDLSGGLLEREGFTFHLLTASAGPTTAVGSCMMLDENN